MSSDNIQSLNNDDNKFILKLRCKDITTYCV